MTSNSTSGRVSRSQWVALGVLTLVYTLHTVDRNIVSALVEPIKKEFALSDRAVGALSGLAHSAAFAAAVIPMGWLVDRVNRARMLGVLLVAWSSMTALSGFATSYTSLLLARLAVGGAEAGSSPNCLSLISDYFPPRRRASAIGLFYLSTAIGTGLVFVLGAIVAHRFGWRTMFFVAGLPGLLLAAVILAVFKEPRRGSFDAVAATGPGEVVGVAAHFLKNRSVLLLTVAIILAAMLMSSLWTWTASFLIRLHGLDPRQAGLVVAMVAGVGQAVGSAVAGPLADRVSLGAPGRLAIVPSVMMALAVLAGLGMVFAPHAGLAVGCAVVMGFLLGGWLGPGYGLLLTLTPVQIRGRVTAVSQLCTNLVGVGLGPLITGELSDLFDGPGSLREALACTLFLGVLAAGMFALAGRQAGIDLRRKQRIDDTDSRVMVSA